jgi:hypothetical protein
MEDLKMKPVTIALTSMAVVALSLAQIKTAEKSVVVRGEQFARAIGKKLFGPVKTAGIPRDRMDNAQAIGVSWGNDLLFGISIDPQTLRVIEARDLTTFESSEAKAKAGEPTKVDREQALALARAAVGASGAEPGDWRVTQVSLYEPKVPEADPSKHWKIWFNRYEGGYGSERDSIYVKIDPYDSVVEYFHSEAATRLPVAGKPITEGRARTLAKDAFRRMADGWLSSSVEVEPRQYHPGASWKAISDSSNVSRLAYTYLFDVKARDVAGSSEPSDKLAAGVEVTVDASTSEIWWARVVTGGQAGGQATILPRIRLASQFLGDPTTESLGRAFSACDPAHDGESGLTGVKPLRIKDIEVALTRDGRLAWREGESSAWSFGTLPSGELEKVRAYLSKVAKPK